MPSRLHISENQVYENQLKEIRDKTEGGKLTAEQEIDERMKVIALSLDRLEKVIGGDSFAGHALGESGANVRGKFALMGPAAYFASDDLSVGGVTSMVVNQLLPSAINLGPEAAKGIGALINSGVGEVPIDSTQGKAIKVEMEKETLMEHISHADKVGYVTVCLGLIALFFALFKLVEIASTCVPNPLAVHSIVDKCQVGRWKDAHAEAARYRGMAGDLIKLGVNKFATPHNVYEELLSEKLLAQRPKLERFLPFLAVTATAAPLLGLLGTVTGMIMTFKSITMFGNSDPKTVSSGISEALVATEIGLVVAISSLIMHGFLVRMAKARVARLEGIAMVFLNGNLDHPALSHDHDGEAMPDAAAAFASNPSLQPAR